MSKKGRGPLKWDKREPCKSCPYRRDAPLNLWADAEFEDLLANERTQMGTTYGCPEYSKRPDEAQVCVGWLLMQKQNNVPSISLRLVLMTNKQALACYNESLSPSEMYESVEEMCAENGVEW